jgi:hypothetical protein
VWEATQLGVWENTAVTLLSMESDMRAVLLDLHLATAYGGNEYELV